MDATQWPQVGLTRSMEEILPTNNPPPPQQQGMDSNNQRRVNRPQKDQNVNCPRCNSTNTKFCYYNNYSLTQPRYFCKACRRYWTQGGSLRNVPVGGGSRKNRRSTPPSSSSSASIAPTSSSNMIPDLNPPPTNFSHMIPPFHHHQNPSNKIHPHPHHHGQDLNLAFPTTTMIQSIESNKVELPNSSSSPSPASFSALELLRTGMSSQFAMQDSNAMYTSSGFPNMHEMKPGLMGFPGPVHGLGLGPSFSVGGLQQTMMSHGNNNHQGSGGGAKLLFPFGDMNKFSSHQSDATRSDQVDSHQSMKGSSQDHHQQQGASGYWNGMLGGGTW